LLPYLSRLNKLRDNAVNLANIANDDWADFVHKLRNFVGRRVAADCVDDLVGEIMLRLASNKDKLKTVSSAAAWMYRVATNVLTDHYRHRAVERRLFYPEHEAVSEETSVEQMTLSPEQELAHCLLPLIADLPVIYREAVRLVDIEGTPQIEVANLLGLSPSGMKSRVQRGRLKLKQRLQKCCTVETDKRGGIVAYSGNSNCC
jgi:RNA polymerase sigma-70 factor, ECF subfamily